jgi:uncharacterized protein YjbI with pentapeptide repeats
MVSQSPPAKKDIQSLDVPDQISPNTDTADLTSTEAGQRWISCEDTTPPNDGAIEPKVVMPEDIVLPDDHSIPAQKLTIDSDLPSTEEQPPSPKGDRRAKKNPYKGKKERQGKDPEPDTDEAEGLRVWELSDQEWREHFAQLEEIPHREAVDLLQAGEVLRDKHLPFLNFFRLNFEQPLVFENCRITGFLARGTTFENDIVLRNCWIEERFRIGDARREHIDLHECSTLKGGIQLLNCRADDSFLILNTQIAGEVRFTRTQFAREVSLDKCQIANSVHFTGPGQATGCSLFRAHLDKDLNFADFTLHGNDKRPALDLKSSCILGSLVFKQCALTQRIELRRAELGRDNYVAWLTERTKLVEVDISEAIFRGEVKFEKCQFAGEFNACPPRHEHGHKKGRNTVFEGDFTFIECHFEEPCNFQNAIFKRYANFSHCNFGKGGHFNQASFGKEVSFWKSRADQSLHFRKAEFQAKANFGNCILAARSSFNEAHFQDEALFYEAQFNGDVFFSGATFDKRLKLNKVTCSGGLVLEKITIAGEINLLNSQIEDRLIMSSSQIGTLQASGLRIGTWFGLVDASVFGDVILNGCRIGTRIDPTQPAKEGIIPGSFYLDNTVLHRNLQAHSAEVKGTFSLEGISIQGEADLTQMRIGVDLVLSKGFFRNIVRLDKTDCKGMVASYLTRYRDEVSFNHLTSQDFGLGGSSFDQGFSMRNAKIERNLTLNNVDVDGKADLSKCQFDGIFFDNMLVDYLMIEREQIGPHLTSELRGNYKQAKHEYGILRQAFFVRNRYRDMDWAYYRFCQTNRKDKKLSWKHPIRSLLIFLEWLLLDLGFGYGTKPMNIAGVAFGVVAVVAVLFGLFPHGIADHNGTALTSIRWFDSLFLSVVSFASMEYTAFQPHPAHWLKYIAAFEGLLGIFLVTLFVATISRKIIRT